MNRPYDDADPADIDGCPFRTTNYEYKVSLGVVMDVDSLSWETRVYCRYWRDVKHLIDAWTDAREFPVIEIDTAYRPTADHPNAE